MEFDMNEVNITMLESYVKKARPMEEIFSVKGRQQL